MDVPESTPTVDLSLSMERANLIALPLCFGAFALVAVAHYAIWGTFDVIAAFTRPAWWVILGLLVLGVLIHEALHALAFLALGKARASDVHFGLHWRTLTPYAGCRAPLPVSAYRAAVSLPGVLLGVVPVLGGLAAGIDWMSAWGGLFLAIAAGDAVVLWAVRGVPAGAMVLDHPRRVGCLVVDRTAER